MLARQTGCLFLAVVTMQLIRGIPTFAIDSYALAIKVESWPLGGAPPS